MNAAGTYDSAAVQDARTTTYTYSPIDSADKLGGSSGWVHKQPTSVTVDAGQPTALTSTVLYDARGRVLRSSKPGAQGTDTATALAATTLAVYYTAGPNDDTNCGNKPVWAGQPCVTRTAGPVTKHDPARMSAALPIKRVEGYNAFGSPTVTTDTVGTGAAQVVRTATTEYDAADRVKTVAMNTTGPVNNAPVATIHTEYDADTGEVTKNRSVDAKGAELTVTKKYDKLGRLTKYTDAHGGWTATTYDRYGQPITVTDSIGTTRTYTYNRALDHRGYVTKLKDSVAGEIVPTWGPDGQLESQTLPGEVQLTIGYDAARVPTSRTYTRTPNPDEIAYTPEGELIRPVITSDSVVENHRGQWISHTSTTHGTSAYTYDRLGRLTGADHSPAGKNVPCTSRRYGFDQHSNRTTLITATGAAGAACPGTTGGTETRSTYDSADRLVSTTGGNGQAWKYDALGRITAMPTADGTGIATTGYFANDLVASQEVPGVEKTTWTLDPLHRFSTQNTFAWVPPANGGDPWANSVEQVIHYDGDGDEPGWIVEDKTQPDKISRWVEGADGNTAVQTGKNGNRVLQLVNLHGDVVGTLPIADGQTVATGQGLQLTSFDEFGVPIPMTEAATTTTPPARYGWLGAAQRSADTPAGVLLMGVRLYHPTTGRFLQVDPVAGGSASAYDYCNADPVNCTDLGGTFTWKGLIKGVAVVGSIASFIPGPVGAAAGFISAGAYAASGNTTMALTMAAVGAAQLVGAGPAARVGASMVTRAAQTASRVNLKAKQKVGEAILKRYGGANRVVIPNRFGRLKVDLKGPAHNGIPTPHWKFQGYNHHHRNQIPGKFTNDKNAIVRSAPWSMIWKSFKVVRKR